ncbi:MAG: FeoA family protein [Chloroflexota bacterium]
MKLIEMAAGTWVKVTGFDGGPGFEDRLLQHGIYPGDNARVLRSAPLKGPLLVEVSGREIALGRSIASKILVEILP